MNSRCLSRDGPPMSVKCSRSVRANPSFFDSMGRTLRGRIRSHFLVRLPREVCRRRPAEAPAYSSLTRAAQGVCLLVMARKSQASRTLQHRIRCLSAPPQPSQSLRRRRYPQSPLTNAACTIYGGCQGRQSVIVNAIPPHLKKRSRTRWNPVHVLLESAFTMRWKP